MHKLELNRNELVFFLVDMQEKLYPVIDRREDILKNSKILIQASEILGIELMVSEQYPKGLGPTIKEIQDLLQDDVMIYEKISFTACTDEVIKDLEKKNKKQIVLFGMETHICIYQTARDLLALGYDVYLALDAVGSRREENYRNGLKLMEKAGCHIMNTETILFDILKEAGSLDFKKISRLIK